MIRFDNDYLEGAHSKILERLSQTNFIQTPGYGEDEFTERAKGYIANVCGTDPDGVHFLVGGTQSNLTLISAVLRPHQGVIAVQSGHINVHETGAIEATGHKILTVPASDGKMRLEDAERIYREHMEDPNREHAVQPAMVYISDTTELGTIYTYDELSKLSSFCKDNGLLLFIDGARLGYAIASMDSDVTLKDLTKLCDAYYIGGTKVGALFGEAMVIANEALRKDFRYLIKQRGGLLAKGRLIGIQFEVLFEDGLYFDIAKKANTYALEIRDAMKRKGYSFLSGSSTNQQFPILPNEHLEKLKQKYSFAVWGEVSPGKTAVRCCTSWATTHENILSLIEDINRI